MKKDYSIRLIENVKAAKEQWSEFERGRDEIARFKGLFHLRPCVKDITIVSTIEGKPMRGVKCAKTNLKRELVDLHQKMLDGTLNTQLVESGFVDREKIDKNQGEEIFQAKLIAGLNNNNALREFLEVKELVFIASEFILHEATDKSERGRVDVVAYDCKNTVFFFELKTPDSKENPHEQLERYIDKYGPPKNSTLKNPPESDGKIDYTTLTKTVLMNYPIHSIDHDNFEIKGYAVYGDKNWNVNEIDKEKSDERTIWFEQNA